METTGQDTHPPTHTHTHTHTHTCEDDVRRQLDMHTHNTLETRAEHRLLCRQADMETRTEMDTQTHLSRQRRKTPFGCIQAGIKIHAAKMKRKHAATGAIIELQQTQSKNRNEIHKCFRCANVEMSVAMPSSLHPSLRLEIDIIKSSDTIKSSILLS